MNRRSVLWTLISSMFCFLMPKWLLGKSPGRCVVGIDINESRRGMSVVVIDSKEKIVVAAYRVVSLDDGIDAKCVLQVCAKYGEPSLATTREVPGMFPADMPMPPAMPHSLIIENVSDAEVADFVQAISDGRIALRGDVVQNLLNAIGADTHYSRVAGGMVIDGAHWDSKVRAGAAAWKLLCRHAAVLCVLGLLACQVQAAEWLSASKPLQWVAAEPVSIQVPEVKVPPKAAPDCPCPVCDCATCDCGKFTALNSKFTSIEKRLDSLASKLELLAKEPPPVPKATPKVADKSPGYPVRGGHWTYPGPDILSHLLAGHDGKKFDQEWLRSRSTAELRSIHDDLHEGRLKTAYVVYANPAAVSTSETFVVKSKAKSSQCPSGNCPTSGSCPTCPSGSRRGIFGWR